MSIFVGDFLGFNLVMMQDKEASQLKIFMRFLNMSCR